MPACYLVQIADTHLYFDKDRCRCRAPGGRPPGESNTIYFVKNFVPSSLLDCRWNEALENFDNVQRRRGVEWVKDSAYELAHAAVGVLPAMGWSAATPRTAARRR